ncbi:unnamed protein product [Dovyalis caffra]|uniref:Transcription factor CBF/NF-Y/archaeal histone domain-containing protein n=1 Tax=Dovyalis caffra TaxID=77055 RepID=A0AAV1R295_9ROSI|nr:unnamed protein product [Dovyalis caffra]
MKKKKKKSSKGVGITKSKQEKKKSNNKTRKSSAREPVVLLLPSSNSSSDSQEVEDDETKTGVKNQSTKSPKIKKIGNVNNTKREGKGGNFDGEEEEDGTACRFPMARIKRIMKSEDSDSLFSQDVVFLVNKATEKFVEQFSEEAYDCSVQDRKKSLGYKHLSTVVSKRRRFDFLSDFVPEKLKAEDALEERNLTETGQGFYDEYSRKLPRWGKLHNLFTPRREERMPCSNMSRCAPAQN